MIRIIRSSQGKDQFAHGCTCGTVLKVKPRPKYLIRKKVKPGKKAFGQVP